jgi:hypothetical protein
MYEYIIHTNFKLRRCHEILTDELHKKLLRPFLCPRLRSRSVLFATATRVAAPCIEK